MKAKKDLKAGVAVAIEFFNPQSSDGCARDLHSCLRKPKCFVQLCSLKQIKKENNLARSSDVLCLLIRLMIVRKVSSEQCKRAPHDKFIEHDEEILSDWALKL